MIYSSLVLAALLVGEAAALTTPALCASRVSTSRVWGAQPARHALVQLCDAPVEAAAPEEAAVAAAEEPAAAPAPQGKNSKIALEDLEAGAEVEGKIRSVMSYGAFVDVGATTDGLLHVSEISNEFIKDATEKLTAGETVQCRIKAINLEKQQLALTCKDPNAAPSGGRRGGGERKRPDLSEFEGADPKEFITGKVNSITDFGAFVTIKEGVDGLVHISSIQEGGVGKVGDVLTIGQEVKVRITQVDKAKRRIGLSMLEWSEEGEKRGRRGGGGGGGFDAGFGEADKEFQMSAEELEALTVGDDFASPFEAAFTRAATVQEAKAKKEKYAAQVL